MSDMVNRDLANPPFGEPALVPVVQPYEDRLTKNKRWALDEGFRFFEQQSATHHALRRIAQRLNEIGVDYAVVGGMALFHHGFRRFTEDVDILVTREGLKEIHAGLEGLGYVRPFAMSKNLRDAETGVKIEFLLTGDYPGDGKPKSVAFPNPAEVNEDFEGIRFVRLPVFVELKLASGLNNPSRAKDLIDVQELIRELKLDQGFGVSLNPFVRPKYDELWQLVNATKKRYVMTWRNKFLNADITSLNAMIRSLDEALATLKAMCDDGVQLAPPGGTAGDNAMLFTTNEAIANKYGMTPEDEYWDMDEGKSEETPPDSSP